MPRKQRRAAAKYAALGKRSKRRKSPRRVPREPMVASHVEASDAAIVEPESNKVEQVSEPAKPRLRLRQPTPEYRYVTAELKRIGIIAGAVFVILLVLTLALH